MSDFVEDLVKKSQENNKGVSEILINKIKDFLYSDTSQIKMSDLEIKKISIDILKIKNES